VLVALGCAAACLACRGSGHEPKPRGVASASERALVNRSCEGCHVEIAREWRASRHRASASNRAFVAAFQREPDPFCWDCHAPEARAQKGLETPASQTGVACVTCHQEAHGAVVPAELERPSPSRHALRSNEARTGSQACAGCHEFAFPSAARERREMMQTTLSEHARSIFAEQSCAECHMPRVGSDQHRSHALGSTRDPAAFRQAVRVSAERTSGGLRVRIAPVGVGHAFPTGDLFRRLRVVVEAMDGSRVVRREQRYLARHFTSRLQADGAVRREETGDDRPGARAEDEVSTASASAASASPAPAPPAIEYGAPIACEIAYIEASSAGFPLRLHALQGAFLLTRGPDMFRFEDGKLLTQQFGFMAAHPASEFVSLGGRYPDSVSGVALVGTRMTAERGDWYSYDTEDVWGNLQSLIAETNDLPGATWLQGSRLLYKDREFVAVSAAKGLALPKLAASSERDCESEFRVKAFAAAPSGAVLAVGPRCGAEAQLVAERWEGGKSDGRVSALKSQYGIATSATLAVLLGPGKLGAIIASEAAAATTWREVAEGFQELATPVLPDPYSVAVGVDGDLWLVGRPGFGGKRARAFYFSGTRWFELKLPGDRDLRAKLGQADAPESFWLRPNNFAVRGAQVYLAATVMQGNDRSVGSAILTPARPLTDAGADAGEADEPADSGCVPQVVLFAVSKATPADYQYPATRDAVVGTRFAEGTEFVEVLRNGQRTLTAKTKTRREANALAALIRERIAGSRPSVVCEPALEVLRQIPMH
jgi:Cytochrome c554 and c-prime